jgi:hypothetical protein
VFCAALVLAEPAVVVGALVRVDDGVEVDGAGGGEGLSVGVVDADAALDGAGSVGAHGAQDVVAVDGGVVPGGRRWCRVVLGEGGAAGEDDAAGRDGVGGGEFDVGGVPAGGVGQVEHAVLYGGVGSGDCAGGDAVGGVAGVDDGGGAAGGVGVSVRMCRLLVSNTIQVAPPVPGVVAIWFPRLP